MTLFAHCLFLNFCWINILCLFFSLSLRNSNGFFIKTYDPQIFIFLNRPKKMYIYEYLLLYWNQKINKYFKFNLNSCTIIGTYFYWTYFLHKNWLTKFKVSILNGSCTYNLTEGLQMLKFVHLPNIFTYLIFIPVPSSSHC